MAAPLLFTVNTHAYRQNGFASIPVNWRVHAKDFLSDNLAKKVMPISGDFEEWCAHPCQRRSMPGALDLVRSRALIDIEK